MQPSQSEVRIIKGNDLIKPMIRPATPLIYSSIAPKSSFSTNYTKNFNEVQRRLPSSKLDQKSIRNISYINVQRDRQKKLRIQSANQVSGYKQRSLCHINGQFGNHDTNFEDKKFYQTESNFSSNIMRPQTQSSMFQLPNKVHMFINEVNVNILANNMNQEFIKNCATETKVTQSDRKLGQSCKSIEMSKFKQMKNLEQDKREAKSHIALKKAKIQHNSLERALVESVKVYKGDNHSSIDQQSTNINQLTITKSRNEEITKAVDTSFETYKDEKDNSLELSKLINQRKHNYTATSQTADAIYRDTPEPYPNLQIGEQYFTKKLNVREKMIKNIVSGKTFLKQKKNQLSESKINRSGIFTMQQLGLNQLCRDNDPKNQTYVQNKIKNAIYRFDANKYGLKTYQKYANAKDKSNNSFFEPDPTNASEDLKQIKNFRKIQYEKTKDEVFKKIEGRTLSDKKSIDNTLSKLMDTRTNNIPQDPFNLKQESAFTANFKKKQQISKRKDTKKGKSMRQNNARLLSKRRKHSKNLYQKKDDDFKIQKQKKLEEIRKNFDDIQQMDRALSIPARQKLEIHSRRNDLLDGLKEPQETYQDANIMQIRNINHRITSTRLRILAQQDLPRRYIHKDQFLYDQTFDPLRLRFKVKTFKDSTVTSGKGPDHYFINAMKFCERNMIPQAIEEFRKGLMIKSDHLNCRFNHGVLMFKLGLIKQSESDFQMLVDRQTKDPGAYYNLAIVKMQQGDYQTALDWIQVVMKMCQEIINKARSTNQQVKEAIESYVHDIKLQSEHQRLTFELLYETHMLKAQCLWRINPDNSLNPIEAVKNLKLAVRYKQWAMKQTCAPQTTKQLLAKLKDQFYRETRIDIKEIFIHIQVSRPRSVVYQSKPSLGLKKKNEQQEQFVKKINTIREKEFRKRYNSVLIDVVDNALRRKSKLSQVHSKMPQIQEKNEKSSHIQSFEGTSSKSKDSSDKSVKEGAKTYDLCSQKSSKKSKSDNDISFLLKDDQPQKRNKTAKVPRNKNQFEAKKGSNSSNGQGHHQSKQSSQKQKQNAQNQKGKRKLSFQKLVQLQELKEELLERKINEAIAKEIFFKQKAEKFYKEMREESLQRINSQGDGRFEVMYQNVLQPFKQEVEQEYQTLMDHANRMNNKKLKDKIMNLLSQDIDKKFTMTKEEIEKIELRKQIVEENQGELKKVKLPFSLEEKLMELIIDDNEVGKPVNDKEVHGIEFDGISQILQDQNKIVEQKRVMDERIQQIAQYWDNEIQRTDNKIFEKNIRMVEIGKFIVRSNDDSNFIGSYEKDSILQQMREIYQSKTTIPDHICNVLQLYLEEKEKQHEFQTKKNSKINTRLSVKAIELIKNEMDNYEGSQRAFNLLDAILKHLKFFIRFGMKEKKLIYQNAKFVHVKARTTIFKQGEIGSKMWIILKGKVAVQIRHEDYNQPYIIALLKDGDQFGELGIIDNDQLEKEVGDENRIMSQLNNELEKNQNINSPKSQKYAERKATCITAEDTDLFELDMNICYQIFQLQAEKENQRIEGEEDSKENQDKIGKRIEMLQRVPFFQDVDYKQLMPIALNIVPKNYSFGQYIVKQGEIPPGLILIISGQCQVVATRFGQRYLPNKKGISQLSSVAPRKYGIHDVLLQQFDAETTVLNQVNSLNSCNQNQRVLVSRDGKEIKDRMEFVDVMKFNDLMPGNFFGGRCLMPFEHYLNMKRLYFGESSIEKYYPEGVPKEVVDSETDEHYHTKSLLSIVANSARVQVWTIDKVDMNYLPDKVLKKVFEQCMFVKEEDRPFHESDIEFIIEQYNKWDKFKIDVVERMFELKAIEKFMKNM